MAYSIKVEGNFSSAHNLRGYRGRCEELHGHNWKVEILVVRDELDRQGMVADFKDLKRELYRVLDKLDHKYLNKLPFFKELNPTSENIAKYIFDCLTPALSDLKSVTVWENSASCATYEQ
jgi:6-pyruvoyltetrahydropterin/6-carboxytetrahydropterin synthase